MKSYEKNVQTLLSRQDLAKRWNLKPRTIVDYEEKKVITRVPGVPVPRYNIEEIERIESSGLEVNPLSPLERKRLESKISYLEQLLESKNNLIIQIKNLL